MTNIPVRIRSEFEDSFKYYQNQVHELAKEKGWYERERNPLELLMLIVTELSEAAEAFRDDPKAPSKLPEFNQLEEELAGAVIRIMDMAKYYNCKLAEAITAFHEYNRTRPYRHGGKKY